MRGRKKDVFHLFDDATLKRCRTRYRGFRKRRCIWWTSSSAYTRSFRHRHRPNRCPTKWFTCDWRQWRMGSCSSGPSCVRTSLRTIRCYPTDRLSRYIRIPLNNTQFWSLVVPILYEGLVCETGTLHPTISHLSTQITAHTEPEATLGGFLPLATWW